jgi:hypothetical protein
MCPAPPPAPAYGSRDWGPMLRHPLVQDYAIIMYNIAKCRHFMLTQIGVMNRTNKDLGLPGLSVSTCDTLVFTGGGCWVSRKGLTKLRTGEILEWIYTKLVVTNFVVRGFGGYI